jgi:hypothetical protein
MPGPVPGICFSKGAALLKDADARVIGVINHVPPGPLFGRQKSAG